MVLTQNWTPKGKMPESAERKRELTFIYQGREKSRLQNRCFGKCLMLWDLFLKGGGGQRNGRKLKYVYNIFSSFWHIHEDFFVFPFLLGDRKRGKVSTSCSKNKKWAYEQVKLTISTFMLSLNKKTLMRQIYFNPSAEEVANTVYCEVPLG